MVLGHFISRLVILTIGYLYPAYLHLKYIKHGSIEEDNWYLHWISMAAFTFLENIFDLGFYWLPLYYDLKILMVLYISIPQVKGSRFLFSQLIYPLFIKHEYEIDHQINYYSRKSRAYLADKLELLTSMVFLTALKNQTLKISIPRSPETERIKNHRTKKKSVEKHLHQTGKTITDKLLSIHHSPTKGSRAASANLLHKRTVRARTASAQLYDSSHPPR